MIDVEVSVLFSGTIILGIIASALAFYARKYAISENREFLNFYAAAILIMAIGFMVHTAGDFFSLLYDNESLGHILESIAHVILFASFFLFAVSANKILKASKQYWFK